MPKESTRRKQEQTGVKRLIEESKSRINNEKVSYSFNTITPHERRLIILGLKA